MSAALIWVLRLHSLIAVRPWLIVLEIIYCRDYSWLGPAWFTQLSLHDCCHTRMITSSQKPIIRRSTNQSDTGVSSQTWLLATVNQHLLIMQSLVHCWIAVWWQSDRCWPSDQRALNLTLSMNLSWRPSDLCPSYRYSGNQSVLSNAFKIPDTVAPRGSALAQQDPRFEAKPASGLLFGIPNVGNAATDNSNNDGLDDLLWAISTVRPCFSRTLVRPSPDYGSKEDRQNSIANLDFQV